MAKELAFALINPYMITKSRTGGVIGRFITRTGLELAGARMFGPSLELTRRYAELIRNDQQIDPAVRGILADYVLNAYAPDAKTGARRRVMMLLFEGEDAVSKIDKAAGNVRYSMESAESVRATYGDYILDENGGVRYVEPAVLIGPTKESVAASLKLWAEYSEKDGGLVTGSMDMSQLPNVHRTLVLIKPDNFRFPSARPGNIIDLFSGSGLRIIGAKVHRMTVDEAEQFYGPVRNVLREKLKGKVGELACKCLTKELGISIPADTQKLLADTLGPLYGDHQFYEIIKFMTGVWGPDCSPEEKKKTGKERCLALVYAGSNAVDRIRSILGPTDPSKAQPGSVRREFGQDIMVNAAHASDSPENAERELKIVKVEQDAIAELVHKYYS